MRSRRGICARLSAGLMALLSATGFAWAALPVMVPVGDTGNTNDVATGFGAVSYAYRIGVNEVTRGEYAAFLNAVAATDTHGLYDPNMGITRSGSPGSYVYAATDGTRSVAWVSWYDALRFANWLNNGQPSGALGAASTETGAYTFSGDISVSARTAQALVFLPSENEWYKAAYYQGGKDAWYWAYPTRSDAPPLATLPPGSDNAANYDQVVSGVTAAGAYATTQGYYGTHDQAGNLWEWNEALIDGDRGLRGGSYDDYPLLLKSTYRDSQSPTLKNEFTGFRIAAAAAGNPPPPVNRAPVATADSYAVNAGATLTVAVPGVLANDTDADGNALTAVRTSGPAHGTLALNANGSFTYTPAAGYSGADSFAYMANDGTVNGNAATVAITVQAVAVNRAPVATADSYAVNTGTTLTVAAPGVLANDTDADGNALTAVRVSGPAHGTLALNANGSFTYTPVAGYSGADSFTYRANDGTVNGNAATVAITVRQVNRPPVSAADSYTVNAGATLTVAAPGVLANDTDADGNTLTAVRISGPAHGTLALNANGSFTYTPVASYSGADSFAYRANDGTVNGNTVTVTITVRAPVYALTVGSGSGDGSYTFGTVVPIQADAAPAGMVFDRWTGDIAFVANVASASTTLTMQRSTMTVTATYIMVFDMTSAVWSNGQLTISGKGPAGKTVVVTDSAGVRIGTCVIGSDSTWQLRVSRASRQVPSSVRATCNGVTDAMSVTRTFTNNN